jgi:hypothetical protein
MSPLCTFYAFVDARPVKSAGCKDGKESTCVGEETGKRTVALLRRRPLMISQA